MSQYPTPHSLVSAFAGVLLLSCSNLPQDSLAETSRAKVEARDFGLTAAEGRTARLFTLRNSRGMEAVLTDFGATLVSLTVPDRDGVLADVVLGFDDLIGYEGQGNQYFGCTAGRVANRIHEGRFELHGRTYTLAVNNPPNHLHGGERGFGQRLWTAVPSLSEASVAFRYLSPGGEEGYPGRLDVSVVYSLTEGNELVLEYSATCDGATPVNLTHHSYFNLAGAGAPTVLDHVLQVNAEHYTPTDETLIPTGKVLSVAGTPLDFRTPRRIGDRIGDLEATPALGYDHNYAVRDEALPSRLNAVLGAGPVAVLSEPTSGRVLELYSDQPGLQFYSGNYLFGQWGKGGRSYAQRAACCLETQAYPNAVNEPTFPNTILRPGERYRHLTVHRFRVADSDSAAGAATR